MKHLMRVLVLAPTVLLVAAGASSSAFASCVQATVAERASLAEVVVYGTVTETRQTFVPASGVIRFRPGRFLKGILTSEVEIYLGPTKGGAISSVDYEAARRGEAHTLYLRSAGNGSWQTDVCSGSHVGAPNTEEISFFGAGSLAPSSAPKDNTPLAIVAVAIALIALGGAALARR